MKTKFLLFILVISLMLVSCAADEGASVSDAELLSEAIDSYIENEISRSESVPLMVEYQNSILTSITYAIQSYDLSKETMDVEFTYIDVLQLADSVTDPNISEEEYYGICIDKIHSQEYETTTEVISVVFEACEGGYSIIGNDSLTNVLSGGVLNYYVALLEEVSND